MSGLPQAFGVVLLVLSVILCAAPYAERMNFGQLNIPEFSEIAKKRLKFIGPIILASCLLLFAPIFRVNEPGASATLSSPPVLPTSSTQVAATPGNVTGEKNNTNASNGGKLPINGNAKTEAPPASSQHTDAPSTCNDPVYVAHFWDDTAWEGNAPIAADFFIDQPVTITNICTRHRGWKGIPPAGAYIKLLNSAGQELESCKITSSGEEWKCSTKNIQLPVGTYTVIDPNPASWSQNAATNHKGMFFVLGCPTVK